jgi:carboxyl-terminal processing protease
VSTPSPTPTLLPLNIQLSIFENLWTTVNDTYVYSDFNGLDWNAIHQEYHQKIKAGLTNASFYLAMDELITRLGDDHSYFLDPQQVAQQDAEYQGKHDYVGIGIMVSAVPERQHAVILSVFPGSPAEAAGLQPRDSIISVDGTPILDENGYLRDIVRGPEGTSIDILAQTPGEKPREVHITRHRITGDYPIVYSVITTRESKRIGYIFLDTFMDGTVDEQVAHALQEMSADKPLDGLILDNRMNTGGSSAVLEPVLGYFIGGKLGSFIKRSDQNPLRVKLNDINGSSKLPLVVLVGSETASFGEIFAGILQDTGRAYVIGTTTNGNVEILWGYDFEDGSQLWLANETFRPLNHPEQDWEKTGIIPDLTISGDFDQYSLNNDPPVIAALKYLSDH